MVISVSVLVFVLAFVYFYPLTLRFSYSGQQAELQWLPRLCGGFAAPRRLPLRGESGASQLASKRLLTAKRLLARWRFTYSLRLARWLLRRTRIQRLYWRLELCPAASYGFSAGVECILSIRCGDIIGGVLYGLWLYKKGGKKHVQ